MTWYPESVTCSSRATAPSRHLCRKLLQNDPVSGESLAALPEAAVSGELHDEVERPLGVGAGAQQLDHIGVGDLGAEVDYSSQRTLTSFSRLYSVRRSCSSPGLWCGFSIFTATLDQLVTRLRGCLPTWCVPLAAAG